MHAYAQTAPRAGGGLAVATHHHEGTLLEGQHGQSVGQISFDQIRTFGNMANSLKGALRLIALEQGTSLDKAQAQQLIGVVANWGPFERINETEKLLGEFSLPAVKGEAVAHQRVTQMIDDHLAIGRTRKGEP